jgi:hypothetical protein
MTLKQSSEIIVFDARRGEDRAAALLCGAVWLPLGAFPPSVAEQSATNE